MSEGVVAATALGDQHARLARLVGRWDLEIVMVMTGAHDTRSAGSAEYAWTIEGRWLGQRIRGSLMGQPYESFAILGFDGFARSHVRVTVSSMDTAMNVARGPVVDATGAVNVVYGTLDEYMTGELHKPVKVVTREVDIDHHVMEIWDLGLGEAGAMVLEFRFSRVAA